MSPRDMTQVAEKVRELVLAGFSAEVTPRKSSSSPAWAAVRACGTELWLDTGDLEEADKLWVAEFSGLTTNNTLLNKEVQKGIYDELVSRAAGALRDAVDPADLVIEIAFLLNAYHALRLVRTFGSRVSVELHTDMANDIARTLAYARRYWAICPDHFYVKVPMTPAGLLSTRILAREGILINFTLGFSARQNYLASALANPAFVNVFLGRLNACVIDNKLGDGRHVGEKATLASQRAVTELRGRGQVSRQIAASMRNGEQVSALAGGDVFTMPIKVAIDYAAHPDPAIANNVATDYDVEVGTEAANVFWDVPATFRKVADDLAARDLNAMTPEGLMDALAAGGVGDLFPKWSAADLQAIASDGKIPNYARWKERLDGGAVSLDSLLNAAGLASFSVDQKAMDDRIRGLL